MTVIQLWWLGLAIAAIVIVVVAVLLGLILAAAKSIDERANAIWLEGKQIAGNTVALWTLEKTGKSLARMRESLRSLERTVAEPGSAPESGRGGARRVA